MANQYANKVVLSNGTTLIDLTADTVVADKLCQSNCGGITNDLLT